MSRTTARPVHVLIVDDQRPFRRAATKMLERADGFEVVGEAGSGEEGVALVETLRPDLVLMDVRLPGIDGVEATRRIVQRHPRTAVVLVSTYRAIDLPAIDGCGAAGFLPKEELEPEVLSSFVSDIEPD